MLVEGGQFFKRKNATSLSAASGTKQAAKRPDSQTWDPPGRLVSEKRPGFRALTGCARHKQARNPTTATQPYLGRAAYGWSPCILILSACRRPRPIQLSSTHIHTLGEPTACAFLSWRGDLTRRHHHRVAQFRSFVSAPRRRWTGGYWGLEAQCLPSIGSTYGVLTVTDPASRGVPRLNLISQSVP